MTDFGSYKIIYLYINTFINYYVPLFPQFSMDDPWRRENGLFSRDGPKRRRLGGGKIIYDQLASYFLIFDQLASCCVIKSWSIYDHFFVEISKKGIVCWSINLVLFDLLVKMA